MKTSFDLKPLESDFYPDSETAGTGAGGANGIAGGPGDAAAGLATTTLSTTAFTGAPAVDASSSGPGVNTTTTMLPTNENYSGAPVFTGFAAPYAIGQGGMDPNTFANAYMNAFANPVTNPYATPVANPYGMAPPGPGGPAATAPAARAVAVVNSDSGASTA